jgi:iron complex outermembrane receptor protein
MLFRPAQGRAGRALHRAARQPDVDRRILQRCRTAARRCAQVQFNFTGQSDVNYSANGDPGTIQKAFGLLGGNVGIGAADSRWRIGVFAINLLDKRWAAQKNPSPTTTLNPGGYLQYYSPDAVRTIGLTLDFRL